jgi:hypothetical protein
MRRIKNNQLVQGASGNFGKSAEPTEKQVEVRELFGSDLVRK